MRTIQLLMLLCLVASLSAAQTSTTVITSGANWRYLVASSAPDPSWKSDLGFIDGSAPWYSGPSPLGYGGQGPSTGSVVSEGGTCVDQCASIPPTAPSCNTCVSKEITTYFRKAVTLTNVASSTLLLRYQRDDGLVIYINGVERVRENLPPFPATISHSTTATTFPSDADEVAWVSVAVGAGWFQEGANLIAVEVHQLSPTSSDIRFNLEVVQQQPTSPVSGTFISGAVWQYLVTSSDPAAAWKSDLNYDDASAPWYPGSSPLGYGGQGPGSPSIVSEGGTCVNQCVSGTATTPSCLTCAAKSITTYFRKKISLTNVSSSTFTMQYQRDDGIVIYINGVERVRENLPPSPTYSTTATAIPDDAEELVWKPVAIQAGWLQEGLNLIAVEIHQNSAVSSDIRFNMELLQQSTPPVSETFTSGAIWRYLVSTSAPASTWKDLAYSDATAPWYSGPSPLGYGGQGPGAISVTSEGGTCVNQCVSGTVTTPSCLTCVTKEITTYFRKTVTLTNVASSTFTMRYQRDDGIVIYINGIERVRENLPPFPAVISHSTTATAFPSDPDEVAWVSVPIVASWLQEGQNVIAVEVHQLSSGSSDIRFTMELGQGNVGSTSITRGPYLQLGSQTAATIRWRTDVPNVGRITYGLATSALSGTMTEPGSTTEHELRLTNLLPDQKYFYSIGTSTTILEQGINNYFLTAPPDDTKRKIRIASFGDCGNNIVDNNQTKVRDGFLAYRGNTPTDLWMLIGDNSYDGADHQYQTNFFDPYKDNLLKNTMLYAVPGNHDYNGSSVDAASRGIGNFPAFAYFSNFTLPTTFNPTTAANTEEWYSFDYGPIHFVMLDGYGTQNVGGIEKRFYADTVNHPQVQWLKADLAATTKKWKVVYMHFPPYSQGSHNSETEQDLVDLRRNINPILERFGVDLVMTGHSHVYERSYPIHDQYGPMADFSANPNTYRFPGDDSSGNYDGTPNSCPYKNTSEKKKQGTVYVVSGSAGALEPGNLGLHPVMVPGSVQKTIGGSFYMEVEDNRLDARFLRNNSPSSFSITDQFTIMKDVDTVQNLTLTAGQSTTLTASFISDYVWTSPGNASFTAPASRSVTVTPTTSQTFVVKDSKQCIQDVFVVVVVPGNCPGPLFSVKAGNWDDPTVWSCNRIPLATDHVLVKHNILVPNNLQAHAQKVQFDANTKLTYGVNARLLLNQ